PNDAPMHDLRASPLFVRPRSMQPKVPTKYQSGTDNPLRSGPFRCQMPSGRLPDAGGCIISWLALTCVGWQRVSNRSSTMVALPFPDGARREYPDNISGLDIAKGISPSLAKRTVAMALDGVVADLADPVAKDARIEFIGREDPRALELIRHDAAHVLAEAVQTLWPGTQVTIGPVIENGFYYDFFRNQPFTPEDFP